MAILEDIAESIRSIGVKEVARRAGVAPSTVSRIRSKKIQPSFEMIEKISRAIGKRLALTEDLNQLRPPRLISVKRILSEMKGSLRKYGVQHLVIFGSVARGDDTENSDVDIYLDFGDTIPSAVNLLKAEGSIIKTFGDQKVDMVSLLKSPRGKRLKQVIENEGVRVF